ncbi:MAG TPA: AI-2E family transporter [Mucilaginibacter sp.]|nr:AI-2E family transporter [Mucilaginibacter sp.]
MPAIIKKYPFYLKATVVLFGLILTVYILKALSDILIPLACAALLASLLNPVFNWICRPNIPRAVSVLITLLIGLIVVGSIVYLIGSQIAQFGDSFPVLKTRINLLIGQLEQWIYQNFGVTTDKQVAFIKNSLNNGQSKLGSTIGTFFSTISFALLVPTYVFMMLYYKTLLLNFIYEVFAEEHFKRVGEVLSETKNAIQSYMVGLLVEMVIVSVMNSAALLLLGVKYAILVGVIGAILNMLPIVGGIIAIALPVLIATITSNGFSTQLGVIISYLVIQFIDNHIIFPRFVSVKVQINALVSLVAVFLGNALWGIPGMFLSLPLIAVIKIICDRIDDLEPWGKLLGDSVPTKHMGQLWGRRRRNAVLEKGQ